MGKVRIAIVGVGNCASSLVQGLEYYRDAADGARVPGLMHVRFGPYHVSDVEVVAAFDVDTKKVGVDLAEARVVPDIKDEIITALNALRTKYATINVSYYKAYVDANEASDGEPFDAQAVYKTLDPMMLAVLTEPNVNIPALLKTSATNVNTLLQFSS